MIKLKNILLEQVDPNIDRYDLDNGTLNHDPQFSADDKENYYTWKKIHKFLKENPGLVIAEDILFQSRTNISAEQFKWNTGTESRRKGLQAQLGLRDATHTSIAWNDYFKTKNFFEKNKIVYKGTGRYRNNGWADEKKEKTFPEYKAFEILEAYFKNESIYPLLSFSNDWIKSLFDDNATNEKILEVTSYFMWYQDDLWATHKKEKEGRSTRRGMAWQEINDAAGSTWMNDGTDEALLYKGVARLRTIDDYKFVDKKLKEVRGKGLISTIASEFTNQSLMSALFRDVRWVAKWIDSWAGVAGLGPIEKIYFHLYELLEHHPTEFKKLNAIPNWPKFIAEIGEIIKDMRKSYKDVKSFMKAVLNPKGIANPAISPGLFFTQQGLKYIDDTLELHFGRKQRLPGTLHIVFPGNEGEMQVNLIAQDMGIIDVPFRTIEEGAKHVEALAAVGKKYDTVYVGSHGHGGKSRDPKERFLNPMDDKYSIKTEEFKDRLLQAIKKVVKSSGTVFFSACYGANELYALAKAAEEIGVTCEGAAGLNNPFSIQTANGYYRSTNKFLPSIDQILQEISPIGDEKESTSQPKKWKPWEFKYDTNDTKTESKHPIKLKSLLFEKGKKYYKPDRKKVSDDPINKYLLDNNIIVPITKPKAASLGLDKAFVKFIGTFD